MPMLKKIIIFTTLVFVFANANAQRNIYEDVDTTVEDVVIQDIKVDTTYSVTTKEGVVTNDAYDYDEHVDTSINFSSFLLSPDSIAAWKNDKKYAWIKNIDSILHLPKEKTQTNNKQQEKVDIEEELRKRNKRKTEEGEERQW
jgi:hypothetical protein